MGLTKRIKGWLGLFRRTAARKRSFARGQVTHVVILDGTMSSLAKGRETHAGTVYKLLRELPAGARVSLYYEAGIQWQDWKRAHHVAFGRGINRQIRRAYGYLASRYRAGDRIYLIGYSRGAFAVRSLAGVIDRVGLLRPEHATERNLRQAYRLYEEAEPSDATRAFHAQYCHADASIEAVAVWDTVKALGLRLPFLWQITERRHAFHNHDLSHAVKHGFHALALDETRSVFKPLLWRCPEGFSGRVEQVWFRGAHGDIGGQLEGFEPARPLANIPLVWMLGRLEHTGFTLPDGWRGRFPCDPDAPSVGTWRGWAKVFLLRHKRKIGGDPTETIHPTAQRGGKTYDLPLSVQDAPSAGS